MSKLIVGYVMAISFLFYYSIVSCVVLEFIFTHDMNIILQYFFAIMYIIGMSVHVFMQLESFARKGDK